MRLIAKLELKENHVIKPIQFEGLRKVGRPEDLAKKLAMPLDKVRKVLKISKEPVSLETPVGDEEDSSLGDFKICHLHIQL